MSENALTSGYDLSVKYDAVKYGFGAKTPDKGRVDCSGWVAYLQKDAMNSVNHYLGQDVFTSKDMSRVQTGAAYMIDAVHKDTGMLITNAGIKKEMLKEGMIIGEDNGNKGFDKGRPHGIDHITQVVKNPQTGELMISQSHGGRNNGVDLTSVDEYLQHKNANGAKLFLTDPLLKARDLIQQKEQEHSNGIDKPTTQAAPQSLDNPTTPEIPKHHAVLIADATTHVKSWLAERNIEWSETYNQAAHSVACAMHKAGADRVEHFNAQDGRLHGMQRDGAFMMKTCNLDSKEASFTPVAESLAAMRQIDQERTIAQNNPSQDRNLDQNQSKGGRSV
ncbi:MAG: hypothetical protein ACRCV6_09360 [Formosimonas sp.]